MYNAISIPINVYGGKTIRATFNVIHYIMYLCLYYYGEILFYKNIIIQFFNIFIMYLAVICMELPIL